MLRVLRAIGLIAVTLFFISCQSTRVESFARFTLSNESVRLVQGDANIPPISVMVSYVKTDEKNNQSIVILADGRLVDGELLLRENVDKPTEVLITVSVGNDEDGREITSVLKPNGNVDFVLRYMSPISYGMYLVGNDHQSLDENSRFSLVGNIRSLDGFEPYLSEDSGRVYVALTSVGSILDGSRKPFYVRFLMVEAGEFSIDRDIDEPTPVRIEIYGSEAGDSGFVEFLHAILEPGVNYRIVPLGSNGKLAVQADRDSIHSRFVSSWQFDPEFVSLVDQWMDSREQLPTVEKDVIEHSERLVRSYQSAEECAHVNLTNEVKSQFVKPLPTTYQSKGNELVTRRSAALRKILRDTQDLESARMIFDLSWALIDDDEIDSDRDVDERIATLLELEQKMDQAFVEKFITPKVDEYERERDTVLSNTSLLPGQIAPEFTLTTISGDEVTLSEVLSKNEMVLVDFWASWCGPCIRSFPALKRMYSKNKDHGFEIVTISVDDSFEDWKTASKMHRLPWIDVGDTEDGELKGWAAAPSAKDYGVMWIPNKFLIDKKGCIVHKHFSDDDLKKMLSSLDAGSK